MTLPAWLTFFQRTFPSANMSLIQGQRPILIDSGFGSDYAETERFIRDAGVDPAQLQYVVNTHYHSDHVGGNHHLQSRYGVPIAAYHFDGAMINRRDPHACCADWLVQPVEPYTVDRFLAAGDVLETGQVTLEVLHTPGHTLGHISLYEPRDQVLILGDVVHADDVSWINIFREGVDALERLMATLERLLQLPVRVAVSGHGPIHENPHAAMRTALERYERWQQDPTRLAWHATKRIFSYALMLTNGISKDDIWHFLLRCPWLYDYSQVYLRLTPHAFIEIFLAEMLRSGAAGWHDDHFVALTPYTPPSPAWNPDLLAPIAWR